MAIFISPSGNPEVWGKKPAGYFTPEEWQAAHPAPEPTPPTTEDLFIFLRMERDQKLSASDFHVLPDAPGDAAAWMAYRQALRDLPAQADAPWDGGGEQTPWPAKPE